MNTTATSDEKVIAALAHASVFLVFLGPIVPVILWASQRKKSKYGSFHALQAMGYQALILWLWIVTMMLILGLGFFLVFPLSVFARQNSPNAMFISSFIFQIFMVGSILGLMAVIVLAGIAGAISCLLGRDFRYPILGKWLERYLSYDASSDLPMDDTHEDNWVAGMCHATIITRLWGIVTPLLVWFTQKERSARLGFQSMQAFVYQAIAIAAYFLGMAAYLVFFFGLFFTLILREAKGADQALQGPPAAIIMIFFVVILIFWLLILVLMPIYYLLAGYASLRVLRGHHFRYPILGKIIEKRLGRSQPLELTHDGSSGTHV